MLIDDASFDAALFFKDLISLEPRIYNRHLNDYKFFNRKFLVMM